MLFGISPVTLGLISFAVVQALSDTAIQHAATVGLASTVNNTVEHIHLNLYTWRSQAAIGQASASKIDCQTSLSADDQHGFLVADTLFANFLEAGILFAQRLPVAESALFDEWPNIQFEDRRCVV